MKPSRVFNSPVEIGLRTLMLLLEAHPAALDMRKLVILDYLLVHSGDIEGGPSSLHPPSPLRAGEISIRQGLIEDGLHLLASKGLVKRVTDHLGIGYVAEDMAAGFLDALTSEYSMALRNRAAWAFDKAGTLSAVDAAFLLEQTIGKWKTEFLVEDLEEVI